MTQTENLRQYSKEFKIEAVELLMKAVVTPKDYLP